MDMGVVEQGRRDIPLAVGKGRRLETGWLVAPFPAPGTQGCNSYLWVVDMQVAIKTVPAKDYEPTEIQVSDEPCDLSVVQRNANPAPEPDVMCIPSGGAITVWVPARMSSAAGQTDQKSWESLVSSYMESIAEAAKEGAMSVGVPELGVGRLLWGPLRSAQAARKAVDELAEMLPEGFRICFVVKDVDFQDWDDNMRF
jgi:hypothetical protein